MSPFTNLESTDNLLGLKAQEGSGEGDSVLSLNLNVPALGFLGLDYVAPNDDSGLQNPSSPPGKRL